MAAAATTTFAEQRAFAAKAAKEKAAVEWAIQQADEEQREQEQQPRRRAKQRRTTRDGLDIFAVTFFDGDKPKRTDWLAKDAKSEAEFQPKGGRTMSKSRSEPCLGTFKRARRRQDEPRPTKIRPFRTLFPVPAKGIDMRKEAARDQASALCGGRKTLCDLFHPRPETVELSATEKREMRKWGLDVDVVAWPDGFIPPPWVKAVGNTTNKWANREMALTAAREEQEFVEKLRAFSPSRKTKPPIAHHSSSSSSLPSPSAPPPWVKDLPPVRDGRRQFASGEIIPFLEQHVYPEGGVAEAKRARRREKEAFLKTVFVLRQGTAAGVGTGNWRKSGGRGDDCSPSRVGHPSDCGGDAPIPVAAVVPAGTDSGLDGGVTPGAVAAEERTDHRTMMRVEEEVVPGGNGGLLVEHPTRIQQHHEQQEQQEQQEKQQPKHAVAETGAGGNTSESGDHEERRISQGGGGRTTTLDAAGEEAPHSSTDNQQQRQRRRRSSKEGGGVEEAARSLGKVPRKSSKSSLSSPAPAPAPAAAAVSEGSEERAATPSPTVTSSVSVLDIGALQSPE
ncbi:unnamed protein product [Ectocarpus fasciculatus]